MDKILSTAHDNDPESNPRLAAMRKLEAEVCVCPKCPLSETRTHAVPGEGSIDTVVLFVGEGPGYDEDRQGRPFVGKSGRFLTEMIEKVGLRREQVYITNIVKCRPPGNRDPEPNEVEACSEYLDRQLEIINPRIVVTLGRHSMARWFGKGSITKLHGQLLNIGHGRVALAMFHPAAALRKPEWAEAFENDMKILPRLVERAEKANAAAARGEGLPAGVPHPGDADYVEPKDKKDDQDKKARPAQGSLF